MQSHESMRAQQPTRPRENIIFISLTQRRCVSKWKLLENKRRVIKLKIKAKQAQQTTCCAMKYGWLVSIEIIIIGQNYNC